MADAVNLVGLSVEQLQIHALAQPISLLLPASVDGILFLMKLHNFLFQLLGIRRRT